MPSALSLSRTATELKVSKSKLYSLLKQTGIVPTDRGNRKLVSADDIEKMRSVLESEGHQESLFSTSRSQSKVDDDQPREQSNPHVEALLKEKDRTIERLEKLLADSNLQNNRFMESIVGLQKQMSNLNQRLLLNETQESATASYKEVQVERGSNTEEGVLVDDIPPEIITRPSRNFLSPVVWVALLVIAVVTAYEFGGGSASELLRGWLASN
jgi:hypothetical protein